MNDTPSPYKYIGVNNDGHRVIRTDLILLEGLSHCENPVTTEAILEIADPRNQARLDEKNSIAIMVGMMADGYVERSESSAYPASERLRWQITQKGRAHLIAIGAEQIFEDLARCTHIRPDRRPRVDPLTISEAAEPAGVKEMDLNARLRASHARLDSDGVAPANSLEPKLPAVATICLDEEELDEWWAAMDISAKGIAFAEYSLRNAGRLVGGEEMRIPIVGTAGETAEEWNNIAVRLSPKPQTATGGVK